MAKKKNVTEQNETKGTKVYRLERTESGEYFNYFVPVVINGEQRFRVNIQTKDANKRDFYDYLDYMFEVSENNVYFAVEEKTMKQKGQAATVYHDCTVFIVDENGKAESIGVAVIGKTDKAMLAKLIDGETPTVSPAPHPAEA